MQDDDAGAQVPAPSVHDPRPLLRRAVTGFVLLIGIVGVASWAAAPWIRTWAGTFVDQFGLWGVFFGVILTDTFFLGNEPLLGVAYAGGLPFVPIAAVACVASVLAGLIGWGLGRWLGTHRWVKRAVHKHQINALMVRWGVWAVAVAAISPVPYGAATWAAGAAGVRWPVVALGSLFRIPRVIVYFLLVVVVWEAAS